MTNEEFVKNLRISAAKSTSCKGWCIYDNVPSKCTRDLMNEAAGRITELEAENKGLRECRQRQIKEYKDLNDQYDAQQKLVDVLRKTNESLTKLTEPDAVNDDLLEVIIYAINLCDVLIQHKRINTNTLLQFIGNTLHDRERQRLTGREEEE